MPTTDPLHPDRLKDKQRALRDGFALPLTLRVHRALSWLLRAHREEDDLDNRYVFAPFWKHHAAQPGGGGWEISFEAVKRAANAALAAGDTPVVLSILFDRLYVLRNQLLHGGATWNSAANRAQVRDGAAILGHLLPLFIDLMMDNPDEDWAMPLYPVIED
jgi:hypothetical protein